MCYLEKFNPTEFLIYAYVVIIYEDGGDWGLDSSRVFFANRYLSLSQRQTFERVVLQKKKKSVVRK